MTDGDALSEGNFGERHTSTERDWGYYAHLSIYDFAMRWAKGKRFLDAGCGTAYGSRHVLAAGAASVDSLDRDPAFVERLRQVPENQGVRFSHCDFDTGRIPLPDASIDVCFCSNVLEHIAYPNAIVAEFGRVLSADGVVVIAVPPVATPGMLKENAKNIFHINNLPYFVWESKLGRFFETVTKHRHWVVESKSIDNVGVDYASPAMEDFTFPEAVAETDNIHTITAVFVCRKPRRGVLPEVMEVAVPEDWRALRVEAEGRQEAFTALNRQNEELLANLQRHIHLLNEREAYYRDEIRRLEDRQGP